MARLRPAKFSAAAKNKTWFTLAKWKKIITFFLGMEVFVTS